MSSAEPFVRHNKRQSDRAVGHAYSRLALDSLARATFGSLLHCARRRSPSILAAPIVNGRHLGVEALLNLSRFARAHFRSVEIWSGSVAWWPGAVMSLARHFLGRYPTPGFLASAWYAGEDPYSEAKRRWFVAHAAGASFRSLALPMWMTRRMEHIFLGSDDHMGIDYAMRRAELMVLGADVDLVELVLATRLGTDLAHGEFWRMVWLFPIANSHAVAPAQVGPIIDFLHSIRQERVAVETTEGIVILEPPQPRFSMKGRTPRSLVRLMEKWHRGLGLVTGGQSWERSRTRPLILEVPRREPTAPPLRWELTELISGAQLRAEGAALRHCVASYSHRCWRGVSRIWSLRKRKQFAASLRPYDRDRPTEKSHRPSARVSKSAAFQKGARSSRNLGRERKPQATVLEVMGKGAGGGFTRLLKWVPNGERTTTRRAPSTTRRPLALCEWATSCRKPARSPWPALGVRPLRGDGHRLAVLRDLTLRGDDHFARFLLGGFGRVSVDFL